MLSIPAHRHIISFYMKYVTESIFLDTEVAEVVFDRCIKPGTTRVDSKDYSVTFNYEFVEDFQDPVYSLRTNPMRASLFNLLSL